jgi:hypothetical protein
MTTQFPSLQRASRGAKLTVSLCILLVTILLTGCNAGGPITVNAAYGPGIKFSGLGRAYAWAADPNATPAGSPEMRELIRQAVDKHLAAKGFTLNTGGPVDFWVGYRVARNEKDYSGVVAFGQTIEEGSLVLDVINPTNRGLIWRGVARARIYDSDTPDVRRQRMEAAMRGLMDKFPKKS